MPKYNDKVYIKGVRIWGHHGHSDEERQVGQTLEVDVTLGMDLAKAGMSDCLADTADYSEVYRIITEVVGRGDQKLLEAVAEQIARRILCLSLVGEVTVTVTKPHPPVNGVCDACSIEITRKRPTL